MKKFSSPGLFRLAGWLCVFTAGSHLIGHALPLPLSNVGEAQLIDLMIHLEKKVLGGTLTMMDVQNGFSLCYSLFFAMIGWVTLSIAKTQQLTLINHLSSVLAISFFTGGIISTIYFFWIPTVTFFAISAVFGLAALKKISPTA